MKFEVKAKYDVIIIGTGISGLICAIELSKANKKVCLLSKEAITEGSSIYAQGGIAIPLGDSDSTEKHLLDTLKAGMDLNDYETSKKIIDYSKLAFEKLLSYGVKFDLNTENNPHLTKEAGHSHSRVCHSGGDATGRFVTKTLIDKVCRDPNISISQGTPVISIIKDENNNASGVFVEDITKDNYILLANDIVIASGGLGQLFKYTTNSRVSTGDGIAMAFNAGAILQDLEMIQFHPTVLIEENKDPILITEAIRGEGGKLKNINGEYFAKNHHEDGELAPRDILSRAIFSELKKPSSEHVYLDVSSFSEEYFKLRFPTIYETCLDRNIDLFKTGIPVTPAVHYSIGGIKTDLYGRTNINHLWAIGECASNGFHGANRLASNSLLECIVVPHLLVSELLKSKKEEENFQQSLFLNLDVINESIDENKIKEDFKNIQELNSRALGLVKDEKTLLTHLEKLEKIKSNYKDSIYSSFHIQEVKNLISLSILITKLALIRKETIGVHYREDFQQLANDIKHSNINKEGSIKHIENNRKKAISI